MPVLLGVGVVRAETAGESLEEELSRCLVLAVEGDADTLRFKRGGELTALTRSRFNRKLFSP